MKILHLLVIHIKKLERSYLFFYLIITSDDEKKTFSYQTYLFEQAFNCQITGFHGFLFPCLEDFNLTVQTSFE